MSARHLWLSHDVVLAVWWDEIEHRNGRGYRVHTCIQQLDDQSEWYQGHYWRAVREWRYLNLGGFDAIAPTYDRENPRRQTSNGYYDARHTRIRDDDRGGGIDRHGRPSFAASSSGAASRYVHDGRDAIEQHNASWDTYIEQQRIQRE